MTRHANPRFLLGVFWGLTGTSLAAISILPACGEYDTTAMELATTTASLTAEECESAREALGEEHGQIMDDIGARQSEAFEAIGAALDELGAQAEALDEADMTRDERRAAMEDIRSQRAALKQQRKDLRAGFAAERQAERERFASEREALKVECQGMDEDDGEEETDG